MSRKKAKNMFSVVSWMVDVDDETYYPIGVLGSCDAIRYTSLEIVREIYGDKSIEDLLLDEYLDIVRGAMDRRSVFCTKKKSMVRITSAMGFKDLCSMFDDGGSIKMSVPEIFPTSGLESEPDIDEFVRNKFRSIHDKKEFMELIDHPMRASRGLVSF